VFDMMNIIMLMMIMMMILWWFYIESLSMTLVELWNEGVSFEDDYLIMFGDKYDYVWGW